MSDLDRIAGVSTDKTDVRSSHDCMVDVRFNFTLGDCTNFGAVSLSKIVHVHASQQYYFGGGTIEDAA